EGEHLPPRVLDAEAARDLDQRRGDPRLEVLREEPSEAEDESDPPLGHERHDLSDLARVTAGDRLEEVLGTDPPEPERRVRRGLEDVPAPRLDERRMPEDLPGREQVEQDAAAVRHEDREPRDAGEHDVEVLRLAARLVDDLI